MTQPEYEQKKRECWEEYVNSLNHNSAARYVFDKIFDRAYILGKEKGTITQEEIDNVAEDYVSFEKGGKCYPNYAVERACCRAFKDGAKFVLGKQKKDAEKKHSLTDKEVYALESVISELESLMDGTLDVDYHKEQKSIINALKRIIKKYEKK